MIRLFQRTLTRSYELPVTTPAEAWAYFRDPVAVAAASSHPLRVVTVDPGFSVGARWQEQHGAECDFDLVGWRVVAAEDGRSLTIEGLQAGGRQRATTLIEPHGDGVRITSTLELSPSRRAPGTVVERLLLVVILATGLGMSIVADQLDEAVRDDRAHFGVPDPVNPAP